MRKLRFAVRYLRLRDLLNAFYHPHIKIVETYCSPEKGGWCSQFKGEGKEGVVFKHIDAPYIPGKPNAGGTQLKYKFYETASFIVAKVNDKRSVSLILFEGDKVRPLEMSPSHIPTWDCRGMPVSLRIQGIRLHLQPVYLGPREDILSAECTLKYKASHELEPSRCFV
jgi:bifunctional non-homologous end joining protein LigD